MTLRALKVILLLQAFSNAICCTYAAVVTISADIQRRAVSHPSVTAIDII